MAIKFDSKKQVTNKLKFKPDHEFNNLCLGKLLNVEVTKNKHEKFDEKGKESTWEYAGMMIPNLVFSFKQVHREESFDKAERFYDHREGIITQTKRNGEPIEMKKVMEMYEAMWDRIKHIHDAFQSSPNYKPFGDIPEIDEKADAATRLEQITKFFDFVAASFNKGKNDKPIYVDTNDQPIILWMKLLPEYKEGKYLTFPTFVGEGFIERYVNGVKPTIEVKPHESVELTGMTRKGEETPKGVSGVAAGEEELPDYVRKAMEKDS